MKSLLLLILFFVFTSTTFGQTITERSYKKAKIYLDNHRIIKSTRLTISNGEVNFFNETKSLMEKIALNHIKSIRVPKGSHLLEGALYGAGTMALTAVLIDVQPDPLGIEKDRGAGFYLGMTGVGAGLGALVGSLFPKWKQVYNGDKFVGLNIPIQVDFSSQNEYLTLKIVVKL